MIVLSSVADDGHKEVKLTIYINLPVGHAPNAYECNRLP